MHARRGLFTVSLLSCLWLGACGEEPPPPPDPFCGDGTLDDGEVCDDGNNVGGDGCSADCLSEEFCGNGVEDPGEACDDGNNISGDGCQENCALPSCGDGVIDAGEECDDGNAVDGDACQTTCRLPVCGDGVRDSNEECDDGNNIDADGCEADCTPPVCGNGIADPGEFCPPGDEANLVNGFSLLRDVVVTDLNGDGALDLATANDNGLAFAGIRVARNNGDATFGAVENTILGGFVRNVAAADLDEDGDNDLIAGRSSNVDAKVLQNNGAGDFPFVGTVNTGGNLNDLVLADIDEDGNLDLVAADFTNDDAIIGFGDGLGGFPSIVRINTATDPTQVVVADLNNDNHLDIAVSATGAAAGIVELFFGDGTGVFTSGTPIETESIALSGLVAADFDRDGNLDLAIGGTGPQQIELFFGNGQGLFPQFGFVNVGREISALHVADIDRNGTPDLLAGLFAINNNNDNDLVILFGDGTGAFPLDHFFAAANRVLAIATGDLNGDNALDAAFTLTNSVSLMLQLP